FNKYLVDVEHRADAELAYGVARAHNRPMVDFCSVDPRFLPPAYVPAAGGARAPNRALVAFCSVDRRLLPVGYVPLADFERARALAAEAIGMGCKALMIPSACPPRHSASHTGLFPIWATAQDAGV